MMMFATAMLSLSLLLAQEKVTPRPWGHDLSDLEPDGRVHFGSLDNGLRYAWMPNETPPDRCYVRLHVAVGSLHEDEHELGLAHFLEHMAFNGSENFAAGTLIEWLQSHGMAFGADSNAYTSYDRTVYVLDLPESDEESVRGALDVLADIAGRLLLESEEIEKEKGIVDREERDRMTEDVRLYKERYELFFQGTRYVERPPIGTKEVRSAFDADIVRHFYDKWYRPERMTLILVGDLGERDPSSMIEETFGDLEARSFPAPEDPERGQPMPAPEITFFGDDKREDVEIVLAKVTPREPPPFDRASMLRELPLDFTVNLVNARLYELAEAQGASFTSATLSTSDREDPFESLGLEITCDPSWWREALRSVEQEFRRIRTYGFQQSEFEALKDQYLSHLATSVFSYRDSPSIDLASELVEAAASSYVMMADNYQSLLARSCIESLTAESCRERLRESWDSGALSMIVIGPLSADLGEDVVETWEQSLSTEISPYESASEVAFAYSSRGPKVARPDQFASGRRLTDIDCYQLIADNGTRFNLKRTEFGGGGVYVKVRLGEGALALDPDDYAAFWVGRSLVPRLSPSRHSSEEIESLKERQGVFLSLDVQDDHVAFIGSCSPTFEDVLFLNELICAYISDLGWDEDALMEVLDASESNYDRLEQHMEGPYRLEFLPQVYEDPRVAVPDFESLEGVSLDDLRDWLGTQFEDAPIEVSFVGNLNLDAIMAIALRTYGALPQRRDLEIEEEHLDFGDIAKGIRERYEVDSEDRTATLTLVLPTTDAKSPERAVAFALLAQVLEDRLRVAIRESLGATYTAQVSSTSSSLYNGRGSLDVRIPTDPGRVDEVLARCLEIVSSLGQGNITQGEFDRAMLPKLNAQRDQKLTVPYWMEILSGAQTHTARFVRILSIDQAFEDMTLDTINEYASTYCVEDDVSVCIVAPRNSG